MRCAGTHRCLRVATAGGCLRNAPATCRPRGWLPALGSGPKRKLGVGFPTIGDICGKEEDGASCRFLSRDISRVEKGGRGGGACSEVSTRSLKLFVRRGTSRERVLRESGRAVAYPLTRPSSVETCLLILSPSFAANCVYVCEHPCKPAPHLCFSACQNIFEACYWCARYESGLRFFLECVHNFFPVF